MTADVLDGNHTRHAFLDYLLNSNCPDFASARDQTIFHELIFKVWVNLTPEQAVAGSGNAEKAQANFKTTTLVQRYTKCCSVLRSNPELLNQSPGERKRSFATLCGWSEGLRKGLQCIGS